MPIAVGRGFPLFRICALLGTCLLTTCTHKCIRLVTRVSDFTCESQQTYNLSLLIGTSSVVSDRAQRFSSYIVWNLLMILTCSTSMINCAKHSPQPLRCGDYVAYLHVLIHMIIQCICMSLEAQSSLLIAVSITSILAELEGR